MNLIDVVIYYINKLYFCLITGTASLNVFSMTCYNVDINVDWGCTAREFPLPGDNLHFENILQSKFSNTVVLTRFVGSVCYCRRTDCTDVINGSSKLTPPVLWSVLLGLLLVLVKKFQYWNSLTSIYTSTGYFLCACIWLNVLLIYFNENLNLNKLPSWT